ncbi:hypothetical protein [Nocardioides sp.]|uniref:hypothetical protein n=1 Tax=Nocardioides sp. TaxID=35761 RepID=UPI002B9CCE70|nr:hypothetical protein [Nocardioides sp.]HXH77259.1 hypothetical protein [Nocardioides sp.]
MAQNRECVEIPWAEVEDVRLIQAAAPRVIVRSSGRKLDVRVYADGLVGDLFGALSSVNHGRMKLS